MKVQYTEKQFNADMKILAAKIDPHEYSGIYGVPRGGVYPAIALSALTGLPLSPRPVEGTLVVDDIVDTGATRLRYTMNDFACIHVKDYTPLHIHPRLFVAITSDWVDYWWEKRPEESQESIRDNVARLIQYIGDNPLREGLKDTPARVIKMYDEFFCGYDPKRMPKITVFPNGQDGIVYNEMLIDNGYFFSFCEHHMVPFFGDYYFAYIPDKLIVGASKIARVIDYYAGRLQVAERLVNDVVDCFEEILQPRGLVLVMKARHLCKEMRGIKKVNSPFEAIAVRGCFMDNDRGCKDEFLSRIRK